MAAFDGRVPAQDWINEVMNRRAEDAVEEDNSERENEVEDPIIGKKYQVTVTLELSGIRSGFKLFRDRDGDSIALYDTDVTAIEPVPWEVRSGDIYLRDDEVYHVKDVTLRGATFRAGDASHFVTRDMNFTEAELIHRAI